MPNSTTSSQPASGSKRFLEKWQILLGVCVAVLLLFVVIVVCVVLARKRSKRRDSFCNRVEVQPRSRAPTICPSVVQCSSPIYINAEMRQFAVTELPSEWMENVKPLQDTNRQPPDVARQPSDVERPPSDAERQPSDDARQPSDVARQPSETVEIKMEEPNDENDDLEHEYFYPQNYTDEYETIERQRSSGEYVFAYDHITHNAGYINLPQTRRLRNVVEDEYDYPKNRRTSSDSEYSYAYSWQNRGNSLRSSFDPAQGYYTPLDKDEEDDNFCDDYQSLSRKRSSKKDEMVYLEYVTILS